MPCKILLCGLDNAGKTRILQTLTDDMSPLVPTQGFLCKSLSYAGIALNVWDVGGSCRLYWRSYLPTDALVFVIDAHDQRRFVEAIRALASFLEKLANNIPVLVLCNKVDLYRAADPANIQLDIAHLLHGRPFAVRGCSAKTGEGLLDSFHWLVAELDQKTRLLP